MDFSHLYTEITGDIKRGEQYLFTVTVGQVPHHEKARLQSQMFKKVDLSTSGNKKTVRREIQQKVSDALKDLEATEFSDRQTVAAIRSWTLTDSTGKAAPVSYEVFAQLPEFITEQIEKLVEEANPELDEDFRGEPESAS